MRIKSRFHKYLLSLHKTFAVSSSFKLNQKPFGVFLSAVTSLSGVSCRMLFCHPSFRARERYHHSNPLRVNCRHISADHRHVETSLCFNITFLFRISSHAHDPVWFRHKATWSGQEKIMFGLQIFVFRSPQTRLETSRNTTSRQQSFLSSQAFHLCFICFRRLLLFPFSSFSVLLVPPAHSTFTSPPPQISLYLSPIFRSMSVASSVLFPLS